MFETISESLTGPYYFQSGSEEARKHLLEECEALAAQGSKSLFYAKQLARLAHGNGINEQAQACDECYEKAYLVLGGKEILTVLF